MQPTATSQTRAGRGLVILLLVLLALDLCFMGLHVLHKTVPAFGDPTFSLEQERGLAEYFQYAQEFIILAGLVAAGRRRRARVYFAWALLFLFFLLDDSLAIHEHLADWTRDTLHLAGGAPPPAPGAPPDLRQFQGRNYGEMLIYAAYAVVLLLPLVVGYMRTRDREARAASRCLIALLLVFGFFAGGVDALHGVLVFIKQSRGELPRAVTGMTTLLEDGGEMVTMSVIAWFALSLVGKTPRAHPRNP